MSEQFRVVEAGSDATGPRTTLREEGPAEGLCEVGCCRVFGGWGTTGFQKEKSERRDVDGP